jgi:para-aminobenzoate synthetase component I
MYTKQQAINQMNIWGGQKKPFLFIIDYELKAPLLYPLDHVSDHILFDINGFRNTEYKTSPNIPFTFEPRPIPFAKYEQAFDKVIGELNYGNSYLLNLTFPTQLKTSLDLTTIFNRSTARYKLLVGSKFVAFSPETFVKIEDGIISSYPMKGTIDAAIPNAEKLLLSDPKEEAEHATIVDLIRNDLNKVATKVKVSNYRYIEKVKTFKKTLLQVSSKIEGHLPPDYNERLGNTVFSLLPAGSISGAPKKKTIEIIKKAESRERGYFTGIFGIFNGQKLDSGVLIRFIEEKSKTLVFRSGGGITAQSNSEAEYQELIDKVYVPFI